jgi:DsbC/DsbD-like thiol-disulfide interchange protein
MAGYRKVMRKLAAAAIALLSTVPAWAGETEWQTVAPDVHVRLIASDLLRPDGTTLAALEIDMPSTTKTYWRMPGETGIATKLDLAGSEGIAGHRIVWPYPVVDTKTGYTDFVYYGPTVLPFELDVRGDKPALQVVALMGVCSEICVPVQASFSLPLDFSTPDRGQGLRISQALALAPVDWDQPREPIGDVTFDAKSETLAVPVSDAKVDPLSVIAEVDGADLLFGAPQKSRDGKLVLFPLLGGNGAEGLVGRLIQLTFMTPMGPFELSRRVTPSTPGGL